MTLLCDSPLAIAVVYFDQTSTKPLVMLAHLLTALLPSSHCLLLLTVSFSGQYLKLTVLFCPPLSTASLCLWDLPSLLHFRSRAQALYVSFAPKQIIRVAPTQTETNATHRVPYFMSFKRYSITAL